MVNGISIIICCYNSASRLPQTIKHLGELNVVENFERQIIIVDNASTDLTANVAQKELIKYPKLKDFQVISEETPGLSNARKKGAEMAKYDWILYCDDDNWLDKEYLLNFLQNLQANPTLSILGCGISDAVYEEKPEDWFYNYEHLCAIFNLNNEHRKENISISLEQPCWVCGAGMFIKKQLILNYYKDEKLILMGRTQQNLISGDDDDIINYALKNEFSVGQFANLKIQHFIPAARTTKEYIIKISRGMAFSAEVLTYKKSRKITKPNVLKLVESLIKKTIKLDSFGFKKVLNDFKGKTEAFTYLKNIDKNVD